MINKERKRKAGVSKKIKMEEWDKYFMEVLRGSEKKEEGREEKERKEGKEE